MHTLKDYYFFQFGGSFFRKVKDLKTEVTFLMTPEEEF